MRFFSVLAVCLSFGWPSGLAQDYAESVLTNLQGVGLEIRDMNIQSDSFDLDFEDVELQALGTLEEQGVRVLAPMERDVMPGQPFLEIAIDLAHAQGPSHLYVVKVELREMAKLERPRDREVTMALATWDRKVMGVANRPEKVLEEVDRLLRIFSDEFHMMNQAVE